MTLRIIFMLFILCAENFSLLASDTLTLDIKRREPLFQVNPYLSVLKDTSGALQLDEVQKLDSKFTALNDNLYYLSNDEDVREYWLYLRVNNRLDEVLSYQFYFLTGLDEVELFHFFSDGKPETISASTLTTTSQRDLHLSQELALPVKIYPGLNEFYFRIANHSVYSKQRGAILLNLAEEKSFVNYFLEYRFYHGIALGMLLVMIVFHLFIFLFFRDRTYFFFLINLIITFSYLFLMKHYQEEITFLGGVLPYIRYLQDPLGVLISVTVILFCQSFLSTSTTDVLMHRVMNLLMVALGVVFLLMISLQFLAVMNQVSMSLGIAAAIVVIITSARSLRRGNKTAGYLLAGFMFIFFVPVMYILQFLGQFPFKSTASDFHYFAEAFRSVIFAIGIADRFYGIKQEAVQKEMEKRSLALEKEMQLKMEKTRISRELHDNIGAQLIHISMRMNAISRRNTEDTPPEVDVLKNRLNETIQQLRDTIWVINKDEITFRELEQKITTLLWYYRQSESETSFSLLVDPEIADISLPPHIAINLHRIIQEGLTNAFRHSQASNITISINLDEDFYHIVIRDDGKGFDTNASLSADHYGLENMQKRAEECGATFSIRSTNTGTEIRLELPVKNVQRVTANL